MSIRYFLVIISFIIIFISNDACALEWQTEIICSDPGVGEAALALDASGNPHVSYRLYHVQQGKVLYDRMMYSCKNNQEWGSYMFDGDGGAYDSIAVDNYGYAHISYYDKPGEDLCYAYWNGLSWNKEVIDSYGKVGGFTSIALDGNNNPHISYIDWNVPDFQIKYACRNDSSWKIEEFPGWAGRTSIELDGFDYPHIVAGNKYGFWDGASWNIMTMDSGAANAEVSIDLDSNGNPHIAYNDVGNDILRYAYWNGSVWSIQTIANMTGGEVSLTLDSLDYPYIMYSNCNYAIWDGLSWDIGQLAGGHLCDFTLDSHDYAHIVYVSGDELIYMNQIPEPTTLLLLGLGGLALQRKREI